MAKEKRSFVKGVTVDAPTSRDLDDAIWVEKKPDAWHVQVTITDVASRVPKGEAIDEEALRRAFTRYHATGNRRSTI